MCGRVGTRVFMRDSHGRTVCRNTAACVIRLCDKVFLDKPKPPPNDWINLGTVMSRVRFYGVVARDVNIGAAQAAFEISI